MRTQDIPWQKQGNHWQALFIRENFLAIAATAWAGMLRHGRGLVVCEVTLSDLATVNWHWEQVPHRLIFKPLPEAFDYLARLDLPEAEQRTLQLALTDYCPEQEILLELQGQGETLVLALQNLAIAPADAYAQWHQRWDEF